MIVNNIEYGDETTAGNLEPADIFTNPYDGLTYLRMIDYSTPEIVAVCMETGEQRTFYRGSITGSLVHVIKSASVRIK